MRFCVVGIFLLFTLVQAESNQDESDEPESIFEVQDSHIEDLHTKVLMNTETGEYAEVVVDYGGRVEELALLSQSNAGTEKPQQVLLSHNGDATAIKENMWWKGMFLVPWANRIAYGNYVFYNTSYQLPINENSTDPPRVNSMHGMLAGKVLTVDRAVTSQTNAMLTLSYDFEDEEDGYPFDWLFMITYTLSSEGFDISIMIQNTMPTSPLPLYIGWHPYFLCTTHKAIITFDKCTEWNHVEMNENMNPTGTTAKGTPFDGKTPIGGTPSTPTAYDDEYKAIKPPSMCGQIKTKLYDPDTDKTVVLYQSENMRFLQVFTGVVGTVAIEPMSGMADAFNNHDHLSILSGAEVWEASFGVYLE